jgi:hypothetical protein
MKSKVLELFFDRPKFNSVSSVIAALIKVWLQNCASNPVILIAAYRKLDNKGIA